MLSTVIDILWVPPFREGSLLLEVLHNSLPSEVRVSVNIVDGFDSHKIPSVQERDRSLTQFTPKSDFSWLLSAGKVVSLSHHLRELVFNGFFFQESYGFVDV